MKNLIYTIFALFLLAGWTGCFNYETQFEGPYSQDELPLEPEFPREVVYVSGGNVYIANAFLEDSLLIDASGEVRNASINYAHTQVLFKREDENIQIYDIEARSITGEVGNSRDATWFDYHANNETIYYLVGDRLFTQGPEILAENPLDLRDFFAFNIDVVGVVVTSEGDVIYTSRVTGGNNSYLIRTNGSTGLENKYRNQISSPTRNLRLNQEENYIIGSSVSEDEMIVMSPNGFPSYERNFTYLLGAPAREFESQYGVLRNRSAIVTPRDVVKTITTGIITSIDF